MPCATQPTKEKPEICAVASNGRDSSVLGTVLIAEDEEILRLVVSKMLRKQGFEVIEAADGSSAVDLFREHQTEIGVVLLDLTLPGMNELEVC